MARYSCMLVLCLLLHKQSLGQDIEARFAQFELRKAETRESMSVLVERVSLTDGVSRVGTLDSKDPAKFEYQVNSKRTLQRLVFGGKGRKKRMDGLAYPVLSETDLAIVDRESQLIHENVGWFCSQSKTSRNEGVVRFQIKGGVVPMVTNTKWNHPFEYSSCLSTGMNFDHEQLVTDNSAKTICEETLKDGRDRITLYNSFGGVWRVTFNKEEGWFIEETEFFKPIKGKTRDEEIAKSKILAIGGKLPAIKVTTEMLSDYKKYAVNKTEWREVEKNRWVPWTIRISTETRTENYEDEIRLRDWKFKEDVDESLLDETNFTPGKITASIDFKAVRDLFDRSR